MKLDIILNPNPILRKKSSDIDISRIKDYQNYINDLSETMICKDGVGLAAPQTGKNINIVVISNKAANTDNHLVLCNPKITFFSSKKIILEEGCLSVPGFFANVRRSEKIRLKAYNEYGKTINIKAKGLLARVIQHEVDHLNGVLFIDKIEQND